MSIKASKPEHRARQSGQPPSQPPRVSHPQLGGDIPAEQALVNERNLLRTLIDALPVYLFVKDIHSRFVINNLAHLRVLGAAGREEVLGKTDQDFFPAKLAQQYRADEAAVLRSGEPLLEREEPVLDAQGRCLWVLTTKVPLKDSRGQVIGLVGVSQDITAHKQADEVLKQTLQELQAAHEELKTTQMQLIQAAKLESVGTLAAGVAHEVKNPLQIILSGVEYLQRNLLPARDENLPWVLQDIHEAVRRADAIVRELLQLSAPRDLELKPEDLNALVERSLGLLRAEVLACQVRLVRKLSPRLPPVALDPSKMQQVLINLLLNALQAMAPEGVLTVTTRRARGGEEALLSGPGFRCLAPGKALVLIEVHNTGPSIPEPVLAKLFTPFFTTKPQGVGTGLGLPVVKRIVDLHGGAIEIRNAPEGGVRATVVLKAAKPERGGGSCPQPPRSLKEERVNGSEKEAHSDCR